MFLITFKLYGETKNLATAEHFNTAKWFVGKEVGRQIEENEWVLDWDTESKWFFRISDSQSYIIEALKHVS